MKNPLKTYNNFIKKNSEGESARELYDMHKTRWMLIARGYAMLFTILINKIKGEKS